MKIAIAIEKIDMRGGQNRVIAELSARLTARHDVHIFCFEAADVHPDVQVHIMDCPMRHRSIMQEIYIPVACKKHINPRDFDVILAQGGNCFIANATLVHTPHTDLINARRTACSLQTGMPAWERAIRNTWQKMALRNEGRVVRKCAGSVFAVSEQLRQSLIAEYGLSADDVISAPNGVDHERFNLSTRDIHRATTRERYGFSENDFVLLFMGACWIEKGLDMLLSAFSSLTDERFHLLVVGSGDPASVAHLIPDSCISRVHFTGNQPPEPHFAAADAFVFPSRVEGFGLVIAEAAACGLPVVATPVGVGPELAETGVTGSLLTYPDSSTSRELCISQIADAISTMAADPDSVTRMGHAAHERALAYTWDFQAEIIERTLAAMHDSTA